MKSECIDCGSPFEITIKEVGLNKDKRIPLPTRCKACRRSKLIEIKLKKITKIMFKILGLVGGHYESKLQKEQKERNITQKRA